MPKTSGDELFERYLQDHGYEPGSHEPSLEDYGIAKRPDYLPNRGTVCIACEVEQFTPGASTLERRLAGQRTASASPKEVYGPIRKRVESAAKELKPLRALEIPLVVVLANPEGAVIDLSVSHVLGALYGNPTYTIPIDPSVGGAVGEGRFEFGRDGHGGDEAKSDTLRPQPPVQRDRVRPRAFLFEGGIDGVQHSAVLADPEPQRSGSHAGGRGGGTDSSQV